MEATVWGLLGWRLGVEGSGFWVSEVSAQGCHPKGPKDPTIRYLGLG